MTEAEINGRIRMLELQRDRALDECVVLHGKLAAMDAENKALAAQIPQKAEPEAKKD